MMKAEGLKKEAVVPMTFCFWMHSNCFGSDEAIVVCKQIANRAYYTYYALCDARCYSVEPTQVLLNFSVLSASVILI